VNLGDRVLGAACGAEAVATRLEVRLEDRLKHQLQRGLHHAVGGGWDAETAELPARLRNHLLPHRSRTELSALEIVPQSDEKLPDSRPDGAWDDSIDSRCACAPVAPHPVPRHGEESRVIDEVEEVIETATGITDRPLVQLRLHSEYPRLGLMEVRPRLADIHPRTPRSTLMLRSRWESFAMWTAFPSSDYYDPSVPSLRHRPATDLPGGELDAHREGDRWDGSHVHSEPIDG